MKTITLTIILALGFIQLANAQIIDSLPYFKQDQIFKETLSPFLKPIVNAGWEEGVAAFKATVDPNFEPPSNGWIRDSMFFHLKNVMSVLEYQEGGENRKFKPMAMFPAVHKKYLDSNFVFAFFQLPKGEIVGKRGAYDPLKAYDLNPNDLSVKKIKKALESQLGHTVALESVFGLVLVEKPNGKFKVYPKADPFIVLGESDMRAQGLLTDDGTLVLFANNFLKAIRNNDKKAFRSAFGNQKYIEEVWTDMRPLAMYRKLPEYLSNGLKFERIVSFENQAGWRGQFAFYAVVYHLPEGMNASELRAPSDLFNQLYWEEVNLQDLESQDKLKALKAGFAPLSENSIFLGPVIGTLVHEHQNPLKYITVLVVKDPDTNNFNIGMPPTLK